MPFDTLVNPTIEPATIRSAGRGVKLLRRAPAISQGGRDFWLEQTSDFLAGRQRCV
jgi:hypothetical protein